MKIFTNTKFLKKIAILLIIITICSFVMPQTTVKAVTYTKDEEGNEGGTFLDPIVYLLMYVGDAILNLLQNNFISEADILIEAKSEDYKSFSAWSFWTIVFGVIAFVVGVCLAIPTGGTSLLAGVKCFAIGAAVAVSSATVVYQATESFLDDLEGNFDIPLIQYTPYAIFSGQIPALDINFINPMEAKLRNEETKGEVVEEYLSKDFEKYIEYVENDKKVERKSDNVTMGRQGRGRLGKF